MGPLEVAEIVLAMTPMTVLWMYAALCAAAFSLVGVPIGLLGFVVWLFQGAKTVQQRIEEDALRADAYRKLA